jgi:transposase
VSREHRRAKTDRLDTELLMRAFLGWLRGEKRHCSMATIPTAEQEDVRRPNRERENLVTEQTRIVNQIKSILARFGIHTFRPTLRTAAEKLDSLLTAEGMPLLENALAAARVGEKGPPAMVCLLARITGLGIETADMLVHEILSRPLRDRRAVARYAGLTGAPDESGRRRREKGLARAGNARVRRGMIEFA